jgi:hypothetical protein
MTVKELREALLAYPDDFIVVCFDGCCGPVEFSRLTPGVDIEVWAVGYGQDEREHMVGLE